jgi:enamine deaminase RidA (YjgF/YER057c/UK114 family)
LNGTLGRVRPVTDELLLGIAGVTATVMGLFFVGVLLFIEAGMRRSEDSGHALLRPYLRAGTRIVLVVFAIPLLLPLALAAFDLSWCRALFVVMSVVLIAANVDSAVRVGTTRITGARTLLVNEIAGTAGVVAIVALPWILGGARPDREDLTLASLLALATAFFSVGAVVLAAFDIWRLDRAAALPGGEPQRAGDIVFLLGSTGLEKPTVDGAADQLALLWSNVRRMLAGAGMTLDDVVRVTSYLRDDAYAGDNDAARTAALGDRTVPASAVVTGTLGGGWLVDIEVAAAERTEKAS